MSWTGSHNTGLPFWGPVPPSHHGYRGGHAQQSAGRHEQDKQAAARARKEEAKKARAAQRRAAGPETENLFNEPQRTVNCLWISYHHCSSILWRTAWMVFICWWLRQLWFVTNIEFLAGWFKSQRGWESDGKSWGDEAYHEVWGLLRCWLRTPHTCSCQGTYHWRGGRGGPESEAPGQATSSLPWLQETSPCACAPDVEAS